jgi:hypothetical protein
MKKIEQGSSYSSNREVRLLLCVPPRKSASKVSL